jgi:hypothetical protein
MTPIALEQGSRVSSLAHHSAHTRPGAADHLNRCNGYFAHPFLKMEKMRRTKPENNHRCELFYKPTSVPSLFSFSRVVVEGQYQ